VSDDWFPSKRRRRRRRIYSYSMILVQVQKHTGHLPLRIPRQCTDWDDDRCDKNRLGLGHLLLPEVTMIGLGELFRP
jgi:hypothetical protein